MGMRIEVRPGWPSLPFPRDAGEGWDGGEAPVFSSLLLPFPRDAEEGWDGGQAPVFSSLLPFPRNAEEGWNGGEAPVFSSPLSPASLQTGRDSSPER